MKRMIFCLLACLIPTTGSFCQRPPLKEVTITVQYVNTLPDTIVQFQAKDADGKFVPGSLLTKSNDGFAAPPIPITGKPPFTFSAPTQLGEGVFCDVPITGIGPVTDDSFTKFVWRVEATFDEIAGKVVMRWVNDQGEVRR